MSKKLLTFLYFLYSRLNARAKRQYWSSAILALMLHGLAIVIPLLQKQIIDSIANHQINAAVVFSYLMVGLLLAVLGIVEGLLLNAIGMSVKHSIEIELLHSVARGDNRIIKARGAGAFMVSIFGDSEQLSNLVEINFPSMFGSCVASLAIVLISLQWTWKFSIIVVVTMMLMILSIQIANKQYTKYFTKGRELIYELNPKVLEFIENRKSILNATDVMAYESKLEDLFSQRDGYFKTAAHASVFGKSAIGSLRTLALTLFFVVSAFDVMNGQMSLATLIALISYFSVVFAPVFSIQAVFEGVDRFAMLYSRIKENLNLPPKTQLPLHSEVTFHQVSMAYDQYHLGQTIRCQNCLTIVN